MVVILVVVTGGVIFFINGRAFLESKKEEKQQEVVDCLLGKDVKLYLSSDCNYCKEQEDVFGDYFKEMDVVNCYEDGSWSNVCREAKINSAPTWVFPGSSEVLKAEISSCAECKKKNEVISCQDHCYTESEGGNFFRVSGLLNIEEIENIFGCPEN